MINKIMQTNSYYCAPYDKEFVDEEGMPRRYNDDRKVLAKKIFRDDGSIKFMIRIDANKQIYNPANQIQPNNTSRKPSSYKNNQVKYITVGHKVFTLYTRYLQELQPSWLHLARRELN